MGPGLAWILMRSTQAIFTSSTPFTLVCVFENGGRISMCFPRISCSFLEALVPSPPYAVTSGLFQLRSLLVEY